MKEEVLQDGNEFQDSETDKQNCAVNIGEPDTQDESETLLTTSIRIIAHPHAKSLVWKHFGFVPLGESNTPDRRRVLCRLCYRELPYCNNTTNLQYHLQRNHKDVVSISGVREIRPSSSARNGRRASRVPERFRDSDEADKNRASSRKRSMVRVTACSLLTPTVTLEEREFSQAGNVGNCGQWNWHNPADLHPLSSVIIRSLIKDCLPLNTVDGSGFQDIVRLLDPNFVFQSSFQLRSQVVPTLYIEEKRRIQSALRGNKFCSLTLDPWSGRDLSATSYIGVACHFINADWNLDSRYLATLEVPKQQLAYDLSQRLQRILSDWRIQSETDISGCTAAEEADRCIRSSLSLLNLPHVPCLASVLQEAAAKAMQISCIHAALSKLRRFSETVHQAPELRMRVQERLSAFNPPMLSCGLPPNAAWFQVYATVVKLHSCREAFGEIICDVLGISTSFLLSEEDYAALDVLEAVLRPLNEAADTLSNESYPPASLLLPLLFRLTQVSLADSTSDSKLLRDAKGVVRCALNDAYDGEETQQLLRMTMFLDPRLKRLPFFNQKEKSALLNLVKKELLKLYKEDESVEETTHQNLDNSSPEKKSRLTTLLGDIFTKTSVPEVKLKTTQKQPPFAEHVIEKELHSYNVEEAISLEDTQPLHWWRDRENQYPNLSNLARKLLCISATAIPMRRLLSEEGQSWNEKRAALPREDVADIMFLSHNQGHETGVQ